MNAELKTLNETLKNMQKNLVAMGEQMEDVVNRIEIISVDKKKFKTEKRYARVGENVLITNPRDDSHGVVGEIFTVSSIGVSGRIDVKEIMKNNRHWAFKSDEYEVIIEPEQVPIVEELQDELTPNEQRRELIEKTKEFVKVHKTNIGGSATRDYGNEICKSHMYKTEFFTKGNKVTAVVIRLNVFDKPINAKRLVGRSKCHPDDVFNEHIGKAIALARALEIDIPEEFLNAVQPSVAKGQVVKATHVEAPELLNQTLSITSMIPEFDSDVYGTAFRHTHDVGWLGSKQITIIDDTNAIYEVV